MRCNHCGWVFTPDEFDYNGQTIPDVSGLSYDLISCPRCENDLVDDTTPNRYDFKTGWFTDLRTGEEFLEAGHKLPTAAEQRAAGQMELNL